MKPKATTRRCRGHHGGGGGGGGGGRRRSGGGGGGVRGVAGRLPRLVALLAVALAWWTPSRMLVEAECADGLEGILSSNEEACCIDACGMCGGSGCSDVEGTNGGSDCCVDDILGSDLTCGVDGVVAPCIIDPDIVTTPSAAEAAATPSPTAVEGATAAPALAPAAPAAGTATPTTTPPAAAGPAAPTAPTAPAAPTTVAPSSNSPSLGMSTSPTEGDSATAEPPAAVVAAPSAQPSVGVPVAAAAPTASPAAAPTAGSFTPVAPVAGALSNCENGYAGWQTNEACCSEFCRQCGGDGCGALGSADCCFDNIISAGLVCGVDTLEAPCIIVAFTPAPLAEGETAAPLPAPTSAPPATAAPATPAPLTAAPDTAAPAAPVAPVAGTEAPSTPTPVATESPASRGVVGVPTPSPGGTVAPSETVASDAPPVGGGVGTPAPSATECGDGIEGFRTNVACCSASCGQCGGPGCENLEGGASECCPHDIIVAGNSCSDTGVAPCVIDTVEEVDDDTTSSGGPAHRIAGGGRGGRALLVVPWAVAALLSTAGFRRYN
ncbi:unnamed protein product [Ectocarpus fasciculatus]